MNYPLTPLPIQDHLLPATVKTVKVVNEDIATLLNRRAELAKVEDEMQNTTADEVNPGVMTLAADLLADRVRLMQDEIKLRRRIERDVMEPMPDEIARARDDALAAMGDAKAKLTKALLTLGFVNTGDAFDCRVPGSIMPVMLANHPSVAQPRQHAAEVRGRGEQWHNLREDNLAAIGELMAGIDELRGRALMR